MIRSLVWSMLRLVDALLQVLVPPRRDRMAWISDPDYIGNAFHLYRHVLTTRRGLEHVWLVSDPEAGRRIQADFVRSGAQTAGHRLRVEDRHRLRGFLAYLRSGWVFHTHGAYRSTRWAFRRDIVSLWHGMPIKAIGALNTVSPNPFPTFGTLHLATSPTFQELIAAAFRVPVERVLVAGLPRCDVLLRPHPLAPSADAVREAAGVPPDRRLVLWLPTYRVMRGSHDPAARPPTFLDDLPPGFLERLDAAAATTGCHVVVKLHPQDAMNVMVDDLGLDRVQVLPAEAWLRQGIELYDLLAAAEGLISDISSVVIDALVTPRPIGTIGFDPATYTRDVVLDVERLRTCRRIHDLADEDALHDFLVRVRDGVPVAADEDDLSAWLYPAQGEGCEAVLAAVRPVARRG